MKKIRRLSTIIIVLLFALASLTVSFADTDYSQWNSQASYPPDVVGTQLFTSVKFLVDKKILTGYPDGTFKPANNITRAEVAKAVAIMVNKTGNLDIMAKKSIFTDLGGYDWAKGYINTMADAGVIKGITSTTFEPGKNISYAQLITILIRTKGGAASEVESYGTWPNNYILYAQTYGLLGDVMITDWNAPATRGDAAKLIYRVAPKN